MFTNDFTPRSGIVFVTDARESGVVEGRPLTSSSLFLLFLLLLLLVISTVTPVTSAVVG